MDHIAQHKRCNVFSGMGTGKTVSTLTALQVAAMVDDDAPVLILAPLRVATSTWPDESAKWTHLGMGVSRITGTAQERRLALKFGGKYFATNYEQLPWLVEHCGDTWPFKTVIADECTRLKSFRLRQGGQRARALGRVIHAKVDRYVGLTGTPSPNGLADLWGQMWMVDAGERLGRTFDGFKKRWFRPKANGFGVEPLPHAQKEIQAAIADVCLTIDAKDWFDLKEPVVNNIMVDMPPKARSIYRDMERQMFAEIASHEVEAVNAAARTIKCLQLANGAAYVNDAGDWKEVHDAKIDALHSIVSEANGAPVLVAYHFKSDLTRILSAFPEARELDRDPATIAAWNAGEIPILCAHPASAGHGLNLQHGGNILVYFGHWWNLEERMQILERIGPTRQMQSGYDRPVFVHNIIARDTVDELVIERVNSKREVQDILLEALKRRKV